MAKNGLVFICFSTSLVQNPDVNICLLTVLVRKLVNVNFLLCCGCKGSSKAWEQSNGSRVPALSTELSAVIGDAYVCVTSMAAASPMWVPSTWKWLVRLRNWIWLWLTNIETSLATCGERLLCWTVQAKTICVVDLVKEVARTQCSLWLASPSPTSRGERGEFTGRWKDCSEAHSVDNFHCAVNSPSLLTGGWAQGLLSHPSPNKLGFKTSLGETYRQRLLSDMLKRSLQVRHWLKWLVPKKAPLPSWLSGDARPTAAQGWTRYRGDSGIILTEAHQRGVRWPQVKGRHCRSGAIR